MTILAETLIKEEEGLELTSYQDTLGNWTIGYGHLLPEDYDWEGKRIGLPEAENLLEEDLERALGLAADFPHFGDLNEVRQAALVSMCYQMGDGPLHWPKFMEALQRQDYDAAAAAGLASLWARQTPARAQREMVMLRTGEWAVSA